MKRIIGIFALTMLSASCTGIIDDAITSLENKAKVVVAKESVLAYAELAMKQAGMSSSAVTADSSKVAGTGASPAFSALNQRAYRMFAVSTETCVVYGDYLCSADGLKCAYTEDYNACGADYKGKIERTFEGSFDSGDSSYSVTVDFDHYSEKAPTDKGYYFFDGKSVMKGTISVSSANLSLHVKGTSGSYLGEKQVSVLTSSDMSMALLNGELSINGTQIGTITPYDAKYDRETELPAGTVSQSGSMSITELTFNGECATGPVKGEVSTTIDGKLSKATVTACGKGTMTVDGQAVDLKTEDISGAFSPDNGAGEDSGVGFDGIIKGTEGGALLSGDWYYDGGTQFANLGIFEAPDGSGTYIYYNVSTDVNADGDFFGIGDSFKSGSGLVTITADSATAAFDYYEEGTYDSGPEGPQPIYTTQGATTKVYTYKLDGNGSLVFDGITFGKYGTYEEPPADVAADDPMTGYWLINTATNFHEIFVYNGGAGNQSFMDYDCVDAGTPDGQLYTDGDTCTQMWGMFSLSGSVMTVVWDHREVYTYDSIGGDTNDVTYDSFDGIGSAPADGVYDFVLDLVSFPNTLQLGSNIFDRE